MRLRFVGVIIFFSLVAVVLGAVLLGPPPPSGVGSANRAWGVTTQPTPTTDNAIAPENAQTGSSDWKIPAGRQATTQVQAYASATSVLPGKNLTFYVVVMPDTTYAASGALVFATGAIYWTCALDSYRAHVDPSCAGQEPVVPGLQRLMANVMAALVVHPTLPS